jgi:hypothetical protein
MKFPATKSQKYGTSGFSGDKLRNRVPSKNILAATLFLTLIPKGTKGNHIFDI